MLSLFLGHPVYRVYAKHSSVVVEKCFDLSKLLLLKSFSQTLATTITTIVTPTCLSNQMELLFYSTVQELTKENSSANTMHTYMGAVQLDIISSRGNATNCTTKKSVGTTLESFATEKQDTRLKTSLYLKMEFLRILQNGWAMENIGLD
jgi:hypothetical protein